MSENESTSTGAGLDVAKPDQPVPAADDQKATPTEGEATPETQETTEQQEARKQSKFQRRLDRQKSARVAAETEARLLREERDGLRAKLEAQPKTQQGSEEPKREDYPSKSYEEFLDIRQDWRADQRDKAREKSALEAQQGKDKQQQATAGQEKIAKAWAERETSFQAETKDYAAVVGPFTDEEMGKLSHPARMAIAVSDVGPALLYQLAKLTETDPDEFERIADLSPARQIAELGKLETKVSMPAKKTTSAPAPASTTTGGKTPSKDLSKMSQSEYEAHRKSQGARWAR